MILTRVSWTLYIIGFLIVAASWINLVTPAVGWTGWIIGMIGWGLGFLKGPQRDKALYELDDLRKKGVLTEEEYQTKRDQLLRP